MECMPRRCKRRPGGQPGVTGAPLGVLQPGGRPGVTGAPQGVLRPGGQPGVTGAPLGVLQPGGQPGVTGAPLGVLQPGGQPGVIGAPLGVLQPWGQPGVTGAHQGVLQPREQLGAIGAPQREQQPGGQPGVTGAPLGVQQPGGQPGVTGAPLGVLQPGGQPGVTGAPQGALQLGEQLGVTGAPLEMLQPGGQPGVIGAPQRTQQPGGQPGVTGAPQRTQQPGGRPGVTGAPEGEQQPGGQPGVTKAPHGVLQPGGQPGVTGAPQGVLQPGGQPGVTGAPLGVLQPGEQLGVTGAPLGVLQAGGQPGVTGAPQGVLQPGGQPGVTGAPLGVLQPGGQSGVTGAPQGALQPGEKLGAIGAPQREQQPGGQPGVTGAPLGVLQTGGQLGVTGAPQGVLQPGGQPGATGAPLGVLQPGGQPGATGAPQIEQQPGGQSLDDREQQLEEWCRLLEFDTPMATAEESEADEEPPMQPSPCPRFPCDTCFHTFATRGAAANHMRVCRAAEAKRRAQALGSTPSLVETDTQERPTPREFGDEAWAGVTRPGDEAATLLLLAFPRLILAVPPKPGIGQKALIIERLGAFWEGRWRELFDSAMVAARPAVRPLAYTCSDQDPDAIRLSRCRSRCKVGEWSRGLACLTAGELARPSEAMVQSLDLYLRAGPFVQSLESARGSRQGDPLGPFLFAFTQQQVMESVTREFRDLLFLSYADDTYILGPAARILEAFGVLRERLEWVGLEVQAHKCRFWEREGGDVELALPLGMQRVEEGLTVVGVPIGEEGWEVTRLRERLRQLQAPLPWLPLLDHPQMASHLLAIAVSAHPMYLVRTIPPRPEVVEAFRDWDSCLEDCFEQLFPPGTWEHDPDRSRRARMQLHLPVRLGGFGIRAAASLSTLSYVCGWAQAARDIAQLGVAGEEAMFAEYLTTSAGAEFLDPWFAKALEQLPATIRQEMPGLPLCVAAPPLRLFQARQRLLAVERSSRHCFAVAKISKASGGVVTMEDSVVLQGKRVDVAVRRPMAGEAHALEISVADPLSLSPSLLGQWLRQQGDAHVGLAVSRGACREDDTVFSACLLGSLKALIGVALQRAQARVILLRAASSMGGINVDLVDREWDDGDAEGGALWVEAPYMVDSLL
ncbi:unnamed protein product [Closterium sp. NIES-65]|nr:unnamed protein product [Closterium sp. NIES-65]